VSEREAESLEGVNTLSDEDVLTEGPAYKTPRRRNRVSWYRPSLTKEELAAFNRKSDFLGFAQTLGYLAIVLGGASAAIYSSLHWPWYVTAILLFVNGHSWQFLINGFHEVVHDSVFRTRWLNRFFLRIFSFLGWYNHHHFWASHTEHHKYTLHPPDDREVVLPVKYDVRKNVWKIGLIHYKYPYDLLKGKIRAFFGHIPEDRWTVELFPATDTGRRKAYTRWERIVLAGHLVIAVAGVSTGYWAVLPAITFPKMFGRWLQFLCNSAQHVGLADDVTDFRLCCRTIYLNPVVQFLYWHMNYHTEHHMYAAVPCYRLGALHERIRHEMPHCPNGLRETWRQIEEIMKRQEREPAYQYVAELPGGGRWKIERQKIEA
jgi:fatty acid desaturase